MYYIRTLTNLTYETGWHELLVEVNDDGLIYNLSLQYDHNPTVNELETYVTDFGNSTQYDKHTVIPFDLTQNHNVLIDFVPWVKARPTLTLAQYNTYVATKPWYEQAVIRFFVYRLAMGLAKHYGVSITSYTETFILGKVRDWIVATPLKKIAKIVFNNHNML